MSKENTQKNVSSIVLKKKWGKRNTCICLNIHRLYLEGYTGIIWFALGKGTERGGGRRETGTFKKC